MRVLHVCMSGSTMREPKFSRRRFLLGSRRNRAAEAAAASAAAAAAEAAAAAVADVGGVWIRWNAAQHLVPKTDIVSYNALDVV